MNEEYHILGYLDDNLDSLGNFKTSLKVIDKISRESLEASENVVIAISNSNDKKRIFDQYENEKGFNIINFTHFSAIVGQYAEIGQGCVLTPNTIVSCNCKLGKGVFLNSGSQIGHDAEIGDYSSIMANVDIGGGAKIGENVFIGSGSVILPGVKIAPNIKIGAGSVVFRNLKREGTYVGNPAKKLF
jgi:sugar O-acyltransferase (sialic acid O-acetyltransferase NeuD family)